MSVRLAIIDDHPVVAEGLAASFAATDDVEVVARGKTVADAERLLARSDVDVALLDIRLADGNGLAILARTEATRLASVIVLSSFATRQYVVAAVKYGALGFLLKTAPLGELVDAVRRVATGGSAFSAEQLRQARAGAIHLSPREREVVRRMLEGQANDEIGAGLKMSRKTVEAHLSRLYERFGVTSRLELALRAEREAWLDVEDPNL
jgi:DNA-binding NarL/FixJ family response regulator